MPAEKRDRTPKACSSANEPIIDSEDEDYIIKIEPVTPSAGHDPLAIDESYSNTDVADDSHIQMNSVVPTISQGSNGIFIVTPTGNVNKKAGAHDETMCSTVVNGQRQLGTPQADKLDTGIALNKNIDPLRMTESPSEAKEYVDVTTILNCTNASVIRSQDDVGYLCYFCNDRFRGHSDLKLHSLEEHGTVNITDFSDKLDRVIYLDVTDLVCRICDTKMNSLDVVIEHLESVHHVKLVMAFEIQFISFKFGDVGPECEVCLRSFDSISALSEHAISHFSKFACVTCDAKFATTYRLLLHRRTHRKGYIGCKICDSTFKTMKHLKVHERYVHFSQTIYTCGYCGDQCHSIDVYKLHIRWVHFIPPKCKGAHDSGLVIRNKLSREDEHFHNLNIILTCTNATLIYSQESFGYVCYFCSRYFGTPSKLKEHALKVHTNISKMEIYRSYHLRNMNMLDITGMCCKLCGDNFDSLEKVKRHLETTHEKRFYVEPEIRIAPLVFRHGIPRCTYCNVQYEWKYLIMHVRDHRYTDYVCNGCGSGFADKSSLLYHIKTNEEVHGTFICSECTEQFHTYELLKCHKNTYHDVLINDTGTVLRSWEVKGKHIIKESHDLKNKEYHSSIEHVNPANGSVAVDKKSSDAPMEVINKPFAAQGNEVFYHFDNKVATMTTAVKPIAEIIIKYQDEKGPQKDLDIVVRPQQSKSVEHSKNSIEESQKCNSCDKVFVTRDALSLHVKECTSLANNLLDEDEVKTIEVLKMFRKNNASEKIASCEKKRKKVDYDNEDFFNGRSGLKLVHEQQFYNIRTIMECSNATLIRNDKKLKDYYECYFCYCIYEDPIELKTHNINKHRSITREYVIIPTFNREMVAYLDTTELKCNLCDSDISKLNDLFRHFNEEHQKVMFNDLRENILAFRFDYDESKKIYDILCDNCNMKFVTLTSLEAHVRSTVGRCNSTDDNHSTINNDLYNESCGNTKRQKLLPRREHDLKTNVHVEPTNKSKQLYTCDVCKKDSKSKSILRKHIDRIHRKLKNFHCPVCHKGFFEMFELNLHLKVHTKDESKRCQLCHKTFIERYDLIKHLRSHTKERYYECDICDKTFNTFRGLETHKKWSQHYSKLK